MPTGIALKDFSSPRFGNVSAGQVVDADFIILRQMEAYGMVKIDEPKKAKAVGETKPLQSSPAGQVLNNGSANTLETKPELSQLTQATKQPHGATLSTDATQLGGETTIKKSQKGRKRGRKPKQQPKDTD